VTVDAIEGRAFDATVESFSPGTGAKFSLLPPDNSTGNFTKIVQRVPVKIVFAPSMSGADLARLAPGLSAFVKVSIPR
jgi:membrane fusion protein (multidrug efflux system)